MHLTRRGSGRGDKAKEIHAHDKLHVHVATVTVQCSSYLFCSVVSCGHTHRSSVKQPRIANFLQEYFEKPLQMSQTRRKFEPLKLNYCVLARIVCHTSQYQYCDYILWSDQHSQKIWYVWCSHNILVIRLCLNFIFTYMYMYSAAASCSSSDTHTTLVRTCTQHTIDC